MLRPTPMGGTPLPALRPRTIPALWTGVLFLLAACGGDDDLAPTEPTPRTIGSVEMPAALIQVDDAATTRISITVRDQEGQAFSTLPEGASVTWAVSDPAVASVQPVGAGLQADVTGERPGSTQLQATVAGHNASAQLSVNQVATELLYLSGDEQDGQTQATLPEALLVQVRDRHGDGVPGVIVQFQATAGGGTFSPPSAETDVLGQAESSWTLGPDPGEQHAEAQVQGLSGSPVAFRALARDVATGTVTGVVTAGDGETPIQGAVVRVKADPEEPAMAGWGASQTTTEGPQATTDSEGRYVLEGVQEGSRTLVATRGFFRAEFQVEVLANQVVEAPVAALDAAVALAYVPGEFDNIQGIIRDQFNMEITEISAQELASPEVTSQFRFIFVNCGVLDFEYAFDEGVRNNLLDFLAAGGHLYVSDLELPLVHSLFPEHILDMDEGDEGTVTANVVSGSLQAFIGGRSTVDIVFDLDGWAAMAEISDSPEVLLRGDYFSFDERVDDGPLAIAIRHGEGVLVYTSFHTSAVATEDQIAALRYFIFGFGDLDQVMFKMATPASRGVTFRDHVAREREVPSRPHRLRDRH